MKIKLKLAAICAALTCAACETTEFLGSGVALDNDQARIWYEATSEYFDGQYRGARAYYYATNKHPLPMCAQIRFNRSGNVSQGVLLPGRAERVLLTTEHFAYDRDVSVDIRARHWPPGDQGTAADCSTSPFR